MHFRFVPRRWPVVSQLPALVLCCLPFLAAAQCPTLSQNSALNSSDCAPGSQPCAVCPGEQITLVTTGTNIPPGVCVNWYYDTDPTFNPANGDGTLLGCALTQPAPITPCVGCPQLLALFVNACGTEENNEMAAMTSGSGFAVSDLQMAFDPSTGNADIGNGCSWQTPSAQAIGSIQSVCANALIVGAGPGDVVPPGVPVVIFPSAGYDFNYNFGSLCPLSPVIYVLQNGCTLASEAFPNSGGSVTTSISLTCGCSSSLTYNPGSLVGGNGAFVASFPPFPPVYANSSCGFPNVPGGGGGGSTAIQIPPFTYTIPPELCNGGPYYVRATVEVPPGCPPVATNVLAFDVPCPTPALQPGSDICQNDANLDLNTLEDPAYPNGAWSGPGVTGNSFDPSGLLGPITLSFTPTGGCGQPATTTVQVFANPTVSFAPHAPVCAGAATTLTLNFTGQAPFSFDLYRAGAFLNSYTSNTNSITVNVTAGATSTLFAVQNFGNATCAGNNPTFNLPVTPATNATLALSGPATVCAGQSSTFSVDFAGGSAPFSVTPVVNGVAQAPVTANAEPLVFPVTFSSTGNNTISVTTATANGCSVNVSGSASVQVSAAPTATLVPQRHQLCEGEVDTLQVQVNAAAPLILDYSWNGTAQASVAAMAPLTLIPVMLNLGTNIFVINALNGGSCPGVVSGTDTTVVVPRPVATLSGDTTLCAGEMTALRVAFSPNQPNTTLTWAANTAAQTPVVAASSPQNWSVQPSATTTYLLTGVSSQGCDGTVSGSATVQIASAPTATLTGGGDICLNGAGDSLTVTFTGTGPWTFVYSVNNVAQMAITTSQNPYKIFVNPVGYTLYKLVSVSDAVCPGTVSGMAELFVYASSNISLAGDQSFCNSVNTTLVANVTGTAPFIVQYAINGVVQPADTIDEGPYLIPVSISQTTTYSVVSIQSPGCIGDATGSATITINNPPQYANITSNCNPVTGVYTLQFDAVNATPPLTVVSGGGSFNGTQYTSGPIPLASGYNIVFRDANNCGNVTVAGPSICNCSSVSGSMNLTPLTPCAGTNASTAAVSNAQLDGDDILRYILHTNPALPVGTILAWNTTPDFAFQPGVTQPGVTYYISAIVGNNDGSGQVNLNDPCRSVSQGTPVTWQPLPTATLSGDFDLCPGTPQTLSVAITGQGPFSLTYSQNSVNTTVSTSLTTFDINTNLTQSADFQLVSISDALCAGTVSGSAQITVHGPPTVQNVISPCALDKLTYRVEFDVTTADLNTVTISLPGTYNSTTGHFVSDPITAGTAFTAYVGDGFQCGQDTVSGVEDCNCVSAAGTLSGAALSLCQSQTATTSAATGFLLESDDALLYLLVSTPDPTTWTVLASSGTPSFNFNSGTLTAGTTYYIVAAVGNATPSGINLQDACLAVSNAVQVVWKPTPTATLLGNATICAGDNTPLTVQLSGGTTYSLSLEIEGQAQSPQAASGSSFVFNVSPTKTTTYTLASVSSGGCAGIASGAAIVTVQPIPQILGVAVNCDATGDNYVLTFRVSNGAAPNGPYTVAGLTGTFSDTTFTSTSVAVGTPYNVTVSTSAGCSASVSGPGECVCVTDAGLLSGGQDGCTSDSVQAVVATSPVLDGNDARIFVLCENPATLPAGILAVNPDAPVFSFQPNSMTAGTQYFIVAVAGNLLGSGAVDPSDPCLNVSPGVAVRFFEPPTAILPTADTTVCAGEDLKFQVKFTGQSPWSFTYALNGVAQSPIVSPGATFQISTFNVQSDQTFSLVSVSDAHCTGTVSGLAEVNVLQPPSVQLSGDATVCPGDTTWLNIVVENADSVTVEIADGVGNTLIFNNVNSGFTFPVAPTVNTTYTLVSATIPDNDCPATVGGSAVVTLSPLVVVATPSDFNGYGIRCAFGDEGSIALSASGGSGQYTFSWEDGVSGPQRNGLTAGIYAVTVSDSQGCSSTTEITLNEPDELSISFSSQNPRCADSPTGSISLTGLTGGVGPFRVRIGNNVSQDAGTLPVVQNNLGAGEYDLILTDANGCVAAEPLTLNAPPPLVADLGPDQTITFGDSLLLNAQLLNVEIDSFAWSPADQVRTPDQLTTWTQPFGSTRYRIWVQDTAGCVTSDEMTVTVQRTRRVYVPNSLVPGSGDNGVLTVYGGPEVVSVRYLRVYDRWGELVFENRAFAPNDPAAGWDGSTSGREVPGVYVWTTEVEFINGETLVLNGDTTVVR